MKLEVCLNMLLLSSIMMTDVVWDGQESNRQENVAGKQMTSNISDELC